MRCKTASAKSIGLLLAVLIAATGCSSNPAAISLTGVPAPWYTAITDAISEQPEVGAVALMDMGGPCALGNAITVDGKEVAHILDHGVVRLDGDIPAVLCTWYEGTPIEVSVARADDDSGYAELVAGSRPVEQSGNEQSGQEFIVGARTLQVVRTTYPTNPAAGTDFEAFYLDEGSRGRVSLRVSNSDERSAGYNEAAVAADLAGFLFRG
ncbi:MAG: hypothetical protein ABWZ98_18395 [Nakamurella sp.]